MASIKISNLASLNDVALNDVVAIVDDSATTTFKVTQENLLNGSGHTLTQSAMSNCITLAGSGNTITSAGGNLIKTSTIIGGDNNSIGGAGNTIGLLEWGAIIGGSNNNINGGAESRGQIIVGGINNQTLGGGYLSGIYSSEGSTIQAQKSTIHGGGSNNINGGYEHTIMAGAGNIINGGERCATIASNSTTMNGYTVRNVIMGTEGGGINNSRFAQIIGGYSSLIDSNANFQTIIGSNAQITSSSERNLIISCPNGNITSGTNGALISTSNTNITGGDFNATLNIKPTNAEDITGVNGATFISVFESITSNDMHSNTLHTDNIHTYKTESFQVINGGGVSGSVNVDCTLGTIYTFTLNGNITDIDFQNPRDGQRFIFIVNNTSNYTVGSATVDGVSGTVFAKSGNISPANNAYTKYTATFDGTNLFLDEESGFSAV